MTVHAARRPGDSREVEQLRSTLARDLSVLAELHARAPGRETLSALWRRCYDGVLGFRLSSEEGRKAVGLFCEGLTDIPTCLDRETQALLSSVYSELYLNERDGAFPYQSAWGGHSASNRGSVIDGVYAWQRRSGFVADAGSNRCADHLVSELQLLAHLVSPAGADASFADIRQFLDQHLLCWVDRFATRVRLITVVRWYQGTAALTVAYLRESKALLARLDDGAAPDLRSPGWSAACNSDGASSHGAASPIQPESV